MRLVTDYRRLNMILRRPVHPFPTTEQIRHNLGANSKFFAKIDLVSAYHQLRIDEKDQELTTFLVPQGRFCYLRAPMGLSPSGDESCYATDLCLDGLEGCMKTVDDVLIEAPDIETLAKRVRALMDRFRESNVTVSLGKLQVSTTISFGGFVITSEDDNTSPSVLPDPSRLATLRDLPVPTCKKDVQSFLGLVRTFSQWTPDVTFITPFLRRLCNKHQKFEWNHEEQEEFDAIKMAVSNINNVHAFEFGLETVLYCDASLRGLGYVLVQVKDDKVKLIECGSTSLTPAQRNYSVIELEKLSQV